MIASVRVWWNRKASLRTDGELGQGLVEYGLIIALVAIMIVGALGTFGLSVQAYYTSIVGAF